MHSILLTHPPMLRRLVPAALLTIALEVSVLSAQDGTRLPFTARDAASLTTWQVADLSDDGRWLAATAAVRSDAFGRDFRRDGDPTYLRGDRARLSVIDTRSGASRPVFDELRELRGAAWSRDASRLAILAVQNGRLAPIVWERATGRSRPLPVPAGSYVAENSDIRWTADGQSVVVALRRDAWRSRVASEFARLTSGPVLVMDGKAPFLPWDALRREGAQRAVHAIDITTGRSRELVAEGRISSYELSADDSLVAWQEDVTRTTDYDVIFGTENRLLVRTAAAGSPTVLQPSLKGVTVAWAEDGRHYAWSKEGRVWVQRVGEGAARLVAGPDTARGATPDTTAAGRAAAARARFSVVRWSPRGDALLLRSSEGFWIAPADGGERTLMLATNDSLPTAPRHAPVGWSADGRYVYLTYGSRQQWERGIVRHDRETKSLQPLVRDGRLYQGARLSRDGSTLVVTVSDGNRPGDLYVLDGAMTSPRRLTTSNPQLASRALASTRLISYLDVDGKRRHGVAYLPADFRAGTRYPTLFNIYEEFFDDTFDATVNVLTSQGYVVVKPSVGFDIGYPGEAWVKGVTAAANSLIEAGIADSARLGVFGTSYGGYATNLLITQTQRFRAAVNISGKVDLISFYTDSPRLGVRNIHAAEKSQDRIGATLWQQPQKYVAHSAIMFADRITTPLLLVTGAQDSNVPADNTREMFYALRRLGKEVSWVNYMNGGHGTPTTSLEEYVDFHDRLIAFFDRHLKGVGQDRPVEATSLLGEPLHRPLPAPAALARMEAQLAAARAAYERAPSNADSIIWLGRRTAYPGRFNEAIAIFTEGIAKHPNDARMYRHRGHRYITTRRLGLAITDFEKAYALTRGKPDEVEPDGQPNARNIPTSTLQGNIRYHLALAHYLAGDFEKALPYQREDVAASKGNPDMLVASSHWLYMTLRRLGRDAEAAKVLEPISAGMEVIENGSYHRLLLLYKGELAEGELLRNFGAEGGLDDITTAYGVANWHLYNGRRDRATEILRRILTAKGQWASFGYLAAEAEMARLQQGARSAPGRER